MSTRRDRAARAVAAGIWPHVELDDAALVEAYRIGDMVLAEVDRIPDVSELIEASSLGTPGAKALRDSVSNEQARRALNVADRIRSRGTRPDPDNPDDLLCAYRFYSSGELCERAAGHSGYCTANGNPQTDDGAVKPPANPGAVPHPAAQAGEAGWRPAPSSLAARGPPSKASTVPRSVAYHSTSSTRTTLHNHLRGFPREVEAIVCSGSDQGRPVRRRRGPDAGAVPDPGPGGPGRRRHGPGRVRGTPGASPIGGAAGAVPDRGGDGMTGIIRSADEIVARIELVKDGDFLGTETSDLVAHLPFEQAKPWLKDDVTQAAWEEIPEELKDVRKEAAEYLDFAIGKIVNHRGLSAGRSISHFSAWLWLLFRDEEFVKFEDAGYENYGAPQVKVAAQMLDAEAIWAAAVAEHPELARMADGDPCRPDCNEGCGA